MEQLQWLRDDLKEFKDDVKSDLSSIKQAILELQQFKWRLIGMAAIVSAVLGIGTQFLIALIMR